MLLKAGISDKPVVFLFNDTQIVFESMLEDVNNVLNTGDVPNLYGPEEFETIYTACKPDCQKKRVPPTKLNMFAAYIIRVQANIHLVLCMSPLGDAFRERLRKFPSIVNCCTIDWFTEWPDEALQSVGMSALDGDGDHRARRARRELRAVCEAPPPVGRGQVARLPLEARAVQLRDADVSYLELLATYKNVLGRSARRSARSRTG